jgi:hypothetical protein
VGVPTPRGSVVSPLKDDVLRIQDAALFSTLLVVLHLERVRLRGRAQPATALGYGLGLPCGSRTYRHVNASRNAATVSAVAFLAASKTLSRP